jgi:tripartite-type tricarboxylate transporter receptor subunit TctC
VVNRDLPINSVKDLVAYAKARPGALNFGSSGRATSDRLAAELFMLETGTKMVNVPYKGGGVALTDLRAGITQVMFPQLPAVIALATSGDVKPLAVTSRYRLPQLPDVPTLSEALLPDFHVTSWNVVLAPRGLPDDIRKVLSDALVQAVKEPQLQEKMRQLGIEPVGMASAETDIFFEAELQRWKTVIDTAGIKLEH